MSTGALQYGETAGREVSQRVAGYFATEADLQAVPEVSRANGMLAVVGNDIAVFDSAATVGGVAPSAGGGRWLYVAGKGFKLPVRVATAAALAANTRTGNVLLADANGALGSIDGVTVAVGDRVLVKNETTGANNGIYAVTSIGGASAKFELTRAPDADASVKVTDGIKVQVLQGAQADQTYMLVTDAVTLNTTALVFVPCQTSIQRGTATLSAGTVTVTVPRLTNSAQILLSRNKVGGTVTSTIMYHAAVATRDSGNGTFVILACVAAGTINTADTSDVDWVVVG